MRRGYKRWVRFKIQSASNMFGEWKHKTNKANHRKKWFPESTIPVFVAWTLNRNGSTSSYVVLLWSAERLDFVHMYQRNFSGMHSCYLLLVAQLEHILVLTLTFLIPNSSVIHRKYSRRFWNSSCHTCLILLLVTVVVGRLKRGSLSTVSSPHAPENI